MAGDSAWWNGKTLCTKSPKIMRLASGALLGEAGDFDTRDVIELFNKVKTKSGLPSHKQLLELKIDYSGILVLPSGKIFNVYMDTPESKGGEWDCGIYEISEGFFAVGSGAELAFGVMEYGGSARDAVNIACRRDKATRPPIHVINLIQPSVSKTSKKKKK